MNRRIFITGSSGLIGQALTAALQTRGFDAAGLDLRGDGKSRGDIRDLGQLQKATEGCDGIVHLAAVSRVIRAQENPELCWATNVDALHNVLSVAAASKAKPWLIFASSREVYGQADALPVSEDFPLRPVNVYGRSKVEGERLVAAAARDGIRACVIRLSNVYGGADDHHDRVVPAFVRAALEGRALRVDGARHTFDFTYIDDVARGIVLLAELLGDAGSAPPPIHFVGGVATTLGALAESVIAIADSRSTIRHASPRDFDVESFVGNPAWAGALLGWRPRVSLDEGLGKFVRLLTPP